MWVWKKSDLKVFDLGNWKIKTVIYSGGKNEIQVGGLQKEKVGDLGWEELGVQFQRCWV